jgi:hypothetical protein
MRRLPTRGPARPTTTRLLRSRVLRTGVLGAALLSAAALAGAPAARAVPGTGQVANPLPGAAVAAAGLPDGWRLVTDADGLHLVWTARTPLPVTDARVEVRADGRSLGPARVARDGSTVTVDVTAPPRSPGTVQVLASGRRVDAAVTPLAPLAAAAEEQVPGQDAVAVDPGTAGTSPVTVGEYTAPDLAIAGLPAEVEMRAVVVSPAAATAPAGDRPLVLFLHGRHGTCYRGGPKGAVSGAWPCPAGWTPVPSYRGYLDSQRLLASQGYDTVSISADGINGQDFDQPDGGARARSVLVRAHLQLWAGWAGAGRASSPAVIRGTAPADLGRLMLVGHSRGGEGVNRAALDSATAATPPPWHVAGQLLIAPTAFGGNPAPGVPTVVLLPYCDGDVFDLQGQLYVDAGRDLAGTGADPALRSALLVRGANHNYFNSEWTPGTAAAPAQDDWFQQSNPVCGSQVRQTAGHPRVRLTGAEQRRAGAAYTAAAAAVLVRRDQVALGALDGSGLRLPSAGRALVSAHALGARRHPFAVPGQGVTLTSTGGVRSRTCVQSDQLLPERSCLQALPGDFPVIAPHLLGPLGLPGEPQRRFAELGWDAAGGRADLTLAKPVSLAGDEKLALRIFTPPGTPAAHFQVRVTDAAGRSATLGDPFLGGLADAQGFGKAWALELRMPLGVLAGTGVDPSRITRLSVVPLSGPGKLWLVDAWGWRPGLSDATAPVLPRADVGLVTVTEGDRGTRTVTVPVTVSGPARGGELVAVVQDVRESGGESPVARVLTVPAGVRTVSLPFTVTGNTRDDEPLGRILVTLEPSRGIAVGAFSGGLQVRDDDPSPTLAVRLVKSPVAEGSALTYRVTLSAPSNRDVFGWFDLVAPAAGRAELATDDVPADWLLGQGVEPPAKPVPLSRLGLEPTFDLPPGSTSVDLTVPTTADSRPEGSEHVVLKLARVFSLDHPPLGLRTEGTVTD